LAGAFPAIIVWMLRQHRLSAWIQIPLILGTALTLSWLERRRALRRRVEPEIGHVGRNLAIAGLGAAALQLAERPVISRVSALVARRRWGILPRLGLGPRLETVLAVLLLDYTLYVWHVVAHRVPALWRAHAVHHVDRDLDTTTALRFHFAELIASVPWRAGQVLAIGVAPYPLSVWQTFLMVSILFHHSNLELPPRLERVINLFFVTPRMHGIHHSRVAAEVHSNWSSGLTIWDRLHGTLHVNIPQQSLAIGVPRFDGDEDVALGRMLALPFSGADVTPLEQPSHAIESVPPGTLVP
jgi:sterol desaturase/sphingolipid hydroxylase (fatty acid hydroxylase superfamily)